MARQKHSSQLNMPIQYQKRLSQINNDMTVRDLHDFLMHDYKNGLFPFAFSLAIHILRFPSFGSHELWEKKNMIPEYWGKIRDEVINLKRIKEGLLDSMDRLEQHLENIDYWGYLKSNANYIRDLIEFPSFFVSQVQAAKPLDRCSIIKAIYGLSRITTERIDSELEFYKGIRISRRNRGRPIHPILVITALWAQVMKKEDKTQWKDVQALISWFRFKLRETQYSSEISRTPEFDEIRRFLKKEELRAEITKEREQLFGDHDNPNNPMDLQIIFAPDSPRFRGISHSKKRRPIPILCFPDGTTFP